MIKLTDELIDQVTAKQWGDRGSIQAHRAYARAIEAKLAYLNCCDPEYRGIRSQDNEKAPEIVDMAPIAQKLHHASIEGMDDTAGLPPILKKQAS